MGITPPSKKLKLRIMQVRIKVLRTNGISGLIIHELGKDGVTEIQDNSMKTSQNLLVQYNVFVNNQMEYSYENGSYELVYEAIG